MPNGRFCAALGRVAPAFAEDSATGIVSSDLPGLDLVRDGEGVVNPDREAVGRRMRNRHASVSLPSAC